MNEVSSCHVGNAFHEKFWCHQQTEGRLNSSSHYTGSSRLVTILKVLDAPIQVPNIFILQFVSSSSILAPSFVPVMSHSN